MQIRKIAPAVVIAVLVGAELCAETAEPYKIFEVCHGRTGLSFRQQREAVSFTRVTDLSSGRKFVLPDLEKSPLWQVELRPPNGDEHEAAVLDAARLSAPARAEIVESNRGLRLTWQGVTIGEEAGALDVVVTVTPTADWPLIEWRIAVHNRSHTKGLWQVKFPRLVGLTVGEAGRERLSLRTDNSD